MAKMMDELETLELAAHLLGIDENADDLEERVDDKLYETWGIDYDSFRSLCSSLLPLLYGDDCRQRFRELLEA